MGARNWTKEQREAMSANRKAAWAAMRAEQEALRQKSKATPTATAAPAGKSIAAPKVEVTMTHTETGMGVPKRVTPTEQGPAFAGTSDNEVAARMVAQNLSEGPSPQAPPRNLFSGTIKKLDVYGKPGTDPNEPVPGYVLYWFDDIEGGMIIQQAKASGYEMVRKDEVALNDANTSPGNNDLGGNVRRWVSQGPDGSAIYSYLMKKPKWLHELHQTGPDSLEQRVHKVQEQQLRLGAFNANPNDRRYTAGTPGVMTGLPPISIGYKQTQS